MLSNRLEIWENLLELIRYSSNENEGTFPQRIER